MDKFEYNVRASEIKELIKEGDYAKAAAIADTIDWGRVKSIMMLCTISDVYKINRRYVESRDILLFAYERNPNGRLILYYLCELSIKLGDVVSALEYYKHFAKIAPKDASQFILLYKIYEAQDATLEERINVLEELKRRDYKEKWAFELAYLYHLVGQTSLCIDECDEIFLWFGKGKYVIKALELKQLHVPLSDDQIARLNESQQEEIHYEPDNVDGVDYYDEHDSEEKDSDYEWEGISRFDELFIADGMNEEQDVAEEDEIAADEEMEIQIRPVDVSEYNTINLQQEIAENMKELLSESLPDSEEIEIEEYFSDEKELLAEEEEIEYESIDPEISLQIDEDVKTEMKKGITETGVIKAFNKASTYDEMLSQGYDGQISLVVPDEQKVEKQITGQLKIDDILTEWERQKEEIAQKRKAEVRSKIKEQTETLFNDFDTKTKMGLLEKLEKAMVDAAIKAGPSVIKVADIGSELKESEEEEDIEFLEDDENSIEDEEVKRILEAKDELSEEDIEFLEDDEISIEDEEVSLKEESLTEDKSSSKEPAIDEEPPIEEESTEDKSASEEEIPLKEAPSAEEKPSLKEQAKLDPKEVRHFTAEEKARFGRYVQHKKTRRQLVAILDNIKKSDLPTHIIVTGEEGLANMKVVKGIIKEVKDKSGELDGKVIKITGSTLNKKGITATFSNLSNGIVIIEHAADMKNDSITGLVKILNEPANKLMIVLEDNRPAIDELIAAEAEFEKLIQHRIDLNALDNKSLVEYAKNYAFAQEYSIDEFGILALHTRIAEMQTSDHEVTTAEVEEIIEEAMYYADKKNPKHFFDILAGKRYDEEDMIVLREKDFLR
ncbi:MAG: hypothetical protein FWG91_02450 [Lachnospiraceae bacterium]|nr:hypothetical protein [Lachnospiraceae bacterium]